MLVSTNATFPSFESEECRQTDVFVSQWNRISTFSFRSHSQICQATIERNFQPPILFRDVCELGDEEATTAYGAKVPVPKDVDMLVAGTSCVDYSGLNNLKKVSTYFLSRPYHQKQDHDFAL